MRDVLARLAGMSPGERAEALARARAGVGAGSGSGGAGSGGAGSAGAAPVGVEGSEPPTPHPWQRIDDHRQDAPVPRARPDGRSVASYGQEQHLFLDRLWSGDAAYLVPFALRLHGPLDSGALRGALRDVVRRHRVLTSRFAFDDGTAVQVTDPDPDVGLPVRAVEGATLAERERAAEVYGAEVARGKFDLERGPLLRTELLVLGPEEHLLLWIAHHAVADGWSVGVLIDELTAAYRARLGGAEAHLPELPLQFADFAEWQREQLAGERLAARVDGWRERLAHAPAAAVPTDHVRPAVQTFRGATLPFTLPDDTAAGLAALSRRTGATLFAVLLTALHVLVARHSGEPDAVTGVVLTGRARRETERLIGPFANTLPLRVDAAGDPVFTDLLDRVQDTVLDGIADQELPFGHLVKELGRSRDTSRNPLYQVLFSMGSLPLGTGARPLADGLTLRPVGLANGTSRLDLEVTMEQTGDTLAGRIDYNTDLYERRTVLRLTDQFRTLLAAVAADPGRPVSHYPLLAEDEQRRILAATARPERPALTAGFLELFAGQVAHRPDAEAVRCDGRSLSYAELDARADTIAHAILVRTTSAAPVVAVGTGRSLDLLPAIVGILKAGGTYLPLELEYPRERLSYMIADSGAELLLTGGEPDTAGLMRDTVRLDALVPATGPPERVPDDPERTAYVMYTSGSTGRPKGVAVRHPALGNFLGAMADLGVMGPDDVTVALASLPFDGSVIELFLPLAVGATVVVGQRADARDGHRLLRMLDEHGVTVQHGTPSTWRLLLDATTRPLPLHRAVSGGEALPPGLARDLRARTGEVWNLYGPAETCVYSLAQRLADDATPLIGRPIHGTTAHVLDERLRPVPPGVLGELYLGGAGLARGYLNLPELTAARFVAHPVTGERLYRTGDLFRRHDDGSLTFHGRADHQVKLRGHRIEPGEIETALAAHPAVREAVVLLKEYAADDQRLVAYACGDADEAELKAAVALRLPAYMVPARVVCLPAFPLNASGKVDRRALEALPLAGPDPAAPYDPPRTPTEQWLAALWAELLGVERVGVREDFFAAGGHSLLAVKLLHRVHDERGVELPLHDFFAAPTVAGQAARVDEAAFPGDPAALAALEREVDAMTDEEVTEMLARLRAEG